MEGYGKKVGCQDEGAEYNEKAVRESKGSSSNAERVQTDYSIKSKKMKPHGE